jgi:Mg-chelatase subunit ChlD
MDVDDVPSGRAKKTGGTAKKAGRGKRAAKEDDDTEAVPAVKESTPVADKVNAEEAKAEKPTLTTSASTVGAGRLGNHNVEVVFSFDTTGSMYPCLTQVRRKIQEATERLFKEAPNIRIGIIAHGDYCDERSSYVIKSLDLTNDKSKIVKFVEEVGPTGGGDAPECYELVLRDCQKLSWTAGYNHALVLIGDDLPHEKGANPHGISWQEEAKRCGEQGILIYAVQALNRNYAARFYTTIAQSSGGVHLNLDQFSAVTDLLIAICYRERAPEQLEIFEKGSCRFFAFEGRKYHLIADSFLYATEVIAQGRYNRGVRKMFDAMIGRSSIATTDKENLNAVTPGRFQVLNVDRDCAIKDFVQENGAAFKVWVKRYPNVMGWRWRYLLCFHSLAVGFTSSPKPKPFRNTRRSS